MKQSTAWKSSCLSSVVHLRPQYALAVPALVGLVASAHRVLGVFLDKVQLGSPLVGRVRRTRASFDGLVAFLARGVPETHRGHVTRGVRPRGRKSCARCRPRGVESFLIVVIVGNTA